MTDLPNKRRVSVVIDADLLDAVDQLSNDRCVADEGGLEQDSVAMCDLITTAEKRYLERGPYGSVSAESFQKIQQGIQIAIGLYPT